MIFRHKWSVMYILCNEEPLWMSKCLSTGGLIEYKGSWRKTTLCRLNLCAENEEVDHKTLHFDGFNSLFLYRRWYRRFTALSAFSFDSGTVERIKDLSLDEFKAQYDGQKPVLLTELAETWPARTNWTIDQLLPSYGDVAFRISQRSPQKIRMKFKDYVSYMEVQHDEDPLYIFDDKFGESAPALLEDYSVPHLFHEDFFDILDHDQRPPFRWLIIGPERSGASWHVDPGLTSAWNTLLCGRKRWALYPPGRVPAGVTVHVNEEDGDVNIESPTSLQWWLDIYPQLADHDKPLECTQLPGETIFVPSGWWHCVLNLETSIAVTQNFVNPSNFLFVCLDMAPGHRVKGVCRAGLLAIPDEDSRDVEPNNSMDIEELNHCETTHKEKKLKPCTNGSNGYAKEEYQTFSYDIDFLSGFLEEERDHYVSLWSPTNYIGQREMREWLHRLWIAKPAERQLIWKGACLTLNADKWYACLVEICQRHMLPSPLDDEKLPVGTGSNPVFLVSNYVIKIYVEGGLESTIHGFDTELEFYNLLYKVNSPLKEHVPDIVASGFIVHENGVYRTVPWNGKGLPEVIANCFPEKVTSSDDCFSFGVWSKKQFELRRSEAVSETRIWPYLVTKRCKGDIFAHIRNTLSKDDVLHLASFLGVQLRNLHLLPLPQMLNASESKVDHIKSTTEKFSDLTGLKISPKWKPVIDILEERKESIRNRLVQWGDPIPELLIEKAEEYLPQDLALLLDFEKDVDGLYRICHSPSWIHSDIMDDNIHMEPGLPMNGFDEDALTGGSIGNGGENQFITKGGPRKWIPTHIIDFSDLSIGDPLYDLIPLYLDVFRGDVSLLKKFLESYNLPLSRRAADHTPPYCGSAENKFKRISYRATCYCILHEENVLGAIFSLWKELRTATSWQIVEEAVWGELNNYQSTLT
ncbi:F-box protein At1g78280 isoform X3 [Ananas comosus]|uniref:F-box protein At1g78280 isoform X3 n=1 Tax=Ananas comosus TaxID=4615 RepID=A0A6P5FBE5_ANACO|nr:F-box protein At1g78280 isoform X3 [Ananas comosus]